MIRIIRILHEWKKSVIWWWHRDTKTFVFLIQNTWLILGRFTIVARIFMESKKAVVERVICELRCAFQLRPVTASIFISSLSTTTKLSRRLWRHMPKRWNDFCMPSKLEGPREYLRCRMSSKLSRSLRKVSSLARTERIYWVPSLNIEYLMWLYRNRVCENNGLPPT